MPEKTAGKVESPADAGIVYLSEMKGAAYVIDTAQFYGGH